jgi:hypothetical protein
MKRYSFPDIIKIVTLIFMIIMATHATAQENRTLYWMQGIPQSTYSNPAMQPLGDVYVGFPVLSSVYFGFTNTGFALKDVLKKDQNARLYIDEQSLLRRLSTNNYLISDYNHDLISFGFRTRQESFYHFNISDRIESYVGYPRDLLRLIIEGNDPVMGNPVTSLNRLYTDFNHFREYGIGYSRKIDEQWTLGVKAKYLQGLANINFRRHNLELTTHPVNYHLLLQADMMINTSLPFNLAPIDSLGSLNFDMGEYGYGKYATNFKNAGFAADLGAMYQINEQFTLAMSIKDLGFIRWRSGAENFTVAGMADFKGFRYNDFNNEEENDNNLFKQIFDSILDLFDRQETANAYTLMMSPKIYASAAYAITPAHRFALLGKGDIYKGRLLPSVTASYNYQPIRRFGASLSWSMIYNNFSNMGLGFHTNLGPVQLYMVTDNLITSMRPHTAQNIYFQFGINIVTFKRQKDLTAPSLRW